MCKNILLLLAVVGLVSCNRETAKPAPGTAPQAKTAARVDVYGDPLPEGAVARMGTLRLKQTGPYGSVSLSDDGQAVALFGNSIISIVELKTGKLLAQARRLGRHVTDAAFCDQDRTLLFILGQKVYFWAWRDDQPPQVVIDFYGKSGGADLVSPIAVLDGRTVIIARYTGISTPDHECRIDVVDVHTGESRQGYHFDMGRIESVAFSPDGKWLAVADSWSVGLIDLGSSAASVLATEDKKGVFSLAFSPDSRVLAVSDYFRRESVVRMWDLRTKQEADPLPVTEFGTRVVAFTPEGYLAHAGEAGTVSVWVGASRQKLTDFSAGWNVNDMAFTKDGQLAALAVSQHRQREVVVWDRKANAPLLDSKGHHLPIQAAAFSPDGQLLLTATEAQRIMAWRAGSGEFLYQIDVPIPTYGNRRTPAFALSPDGTILAVEDGDRIVFRDPATGVETGGYTSQGGRILSLAFSPDGERLACLSIDREIAPDAHGSDAPFYWLTLLVRDVATGEELMRVPKIQKGDRCAFSGDGEWVAVQDMHGAYSKLTVWSSSSGELIGTIPAYAFAFSPDSQTVAACEYNRSIRLWDVVAGEPLREFLRPEHRFDAMALSADGRVLAVNDMEWKHDALFNIYDVTTGEIIHRAGGHEGGVTALAFSPDGRYLVTGSEDTTALVWELPETVRSPEPVPEDMIPARLPESRSSWNMTFSPDGRYMVGGGNSDAFHLWDANSWQLIKQSEEVGRGIFPVAFTPDSRHILLFGRRSRTLRILDVQTEQSSADIVLPERKSEHVDGKLVTRGRMRPVAVFPDAERILGTQSLSKELVMFRTETGEEIRRFFGHIGDIWSAAVSSDGSRVASGDSEGLVFLWDSDTGGELARLTGHQKGVGRLTFSPDGRYLLSGSWDGTLRIWSAETGRQLHCLKSGIGKVTAIAVSPDGRRMLFGGWDRNLRLWDMQAGREVAMPQFDEIYSHVRSIVFSPDGRYALYSDIGGIWRRRMPD